MDFADVMRDGGVTAPDERGLMPIACARAVLRGASAFVKGEGQDIGGEYVLASDTLWAALLSLADGAEFVEVASRLRWDFHPRGFENLDLWHRYGDAIVPWLATRLDGDGVLHDRPWCVVPCLLACASVAAFDLVWRTRRVEGRTIALATAWLDRHPEAGAAYVAARAHGGDARANAFLAAMHVRGADVPVVPGAAGILALLDACALRLVAPELTAWPTSAGKGARRCHSLRAVAARAGADWGLAIERLEGDRPGGVYPARIAIHAYGSRVGGRYRGIHQTSRPLPAAVVAAAPPKPADFVPWLAERLVRDPDSVWGPATETVSALGLPADARLAAVVPCLVDLEPGTTPSESPTYRALVAALTAG
jgi:hypothetical protein